MRVLTLALLIPLATAADSATVRVSASIASYALVEVDGDCGRLESNSPDALAWLDDLPLVPNDPWMCPFPAMYATRSP